MANCKICGQPVTTGVVVHAGCFEMAWDVDTGWRTDTPETDDRVLCLTQSKNGAYNIVIGYYMAGTWRCGMNSNVVGWMTLPKMPKMDAPAHE